ncbi:hypothetical protein [Massilia glaciei]|uniref:hypothetical protein n=1 Tax=Massilia glaciei TaxID=1524097 RepID=UPI0011B264A4|nr:hypothetical protein [Massilia glaciei]
MRTVSLVLPAQQGQRRDTANKPFLWPIGHPADRAHAQTVKRAKQRKQGHDQDRADQPLDHDHQCGQHEQAIRHDA